MGMPATQANASIALTNLEKDYKDGKITLDEYLRGLQNINSELTNMNGKRFTTTFEVVMEGTGYHANLPSNVPGATTAPPPTTRIPTGPPPEVRTQEGTHGWVTVPPGYPNDTYRVGMSSGEVFNVIPSNQVTNHYWNMTINEAGRVVNPVQSFAMMQALAR
jgi:hypothetical protein